VDIACTKFSDTMIFKSNHSRARSVRSFFRAAIPSLIALTAFARAEPLTVQITGPEFVNEHAEYRLIYRMSETAVATPLRNVDTNWVHRLAGSIYQLPQNSGRTNAFAMMLDWEIKIEGAGDVVTGWYLERGETILRVRRGLFGADTWHPGDELVLLVRVPAGQATRDIDLFAAAVRAEHRAEETNGDEHTSLTHPPRAGTPIRDGAPPEALTLPDSPGLLLLRWPGLEGHSYVLEESPDLVEWSPAGAEWVGEGFLLQSLVSPAESRTYFYRLRIATP
jgi:hypothetical protein